MDSGEKPEIFPHFYPDGDISIGLVEYDSFKEIFRIYMGNEYSDTYDMEADRILSGGGFLDLLLQVHTKDWVTPQHLKDLLDCVTCWTCLDHGEFQQKLFDVAVGMNHGLDEPNRIWVDVY